MEGFFAGRRAQMGDLRPRTDIPRGGEARTDMAAGAAAREADALAPAGGAGSGVPDVFEADLREAAGHAPALTSFSQVFKGLESGRLRIKEDDFYSSEVFRPKDLSVKFSVPLEKSGNINLNMKGLISILHEGCPLTKEQHDALEKQIKNYLSGKLRKGRHREKIAGHLRTLIARNLIGEDGESPQQKLVQILGKPTSPTSLDDAEHMGGFSIEEIKNLLVTRTDLSEPQLNALQNLAENWKAGQIENRSWRKSLEAALGGSEKNGLIATANSFNTMINYRRSEPLIKQMEALISAKSVDLEKTTGDTPLNQIILEQHARLREIASCVNTATDSVTVTGLEALATEISTAMPARREQVEKFKQEINARAGGDMSSSQVGDASGEGGMAMVDMSGDGPSRKVGE